MNEYKQKAKTQSIRVTSRASVKVNESFYTVEYCEERIIPDLPDVDIDKERALLWDKANSETDAQIEDILRIYKK